MEQKTGIGDRIREERERLGFSQPAFAGLAEASKGSQISWEKETAYPNAKVLSVWARIGVDVSYLVTGIPSANTSVLTADEQDMVQLFRAAPIAVNAAAMGALQGGTAGGNQVMKRNGAGSVQIGSVAGDFGLPPKPPPRKRSK